MKWPYKQYYVKTPRSFYRKLYYFFNYRKNWKRVGIHIWKIVEYHLLWIEYMEHFYRDNICLVIWATLYILQILSKHFRNVFIGRKSVLVSNIYLFRSKFHVTKSLCVVFLWNQRLNFFVNCRKSLAIYMEISMLYYKVIEL